jgi:hypothetical protein
VKARTAGLFMAGLLVLYLVFVVQYGLVLLAIDQPIAKAMGIALLVLPLIGGWALASEFLFVSRAEKLVKTLGAEGSLPGDDLPRLPSGRVDPVAADAVFPVYQAAVEDDPESWRTWALLGLAYDASGDRKRARWAMRESIRLSRAEERPLT